MGKNNTEFLVCGTVSQFPDDRWGNCCSCGVSICFRPRAHMMAKRICVGCTVKNIIRADTSQNFLATKRIVQELTEHIKQRAGNN